MKKNLFMTLCLAISFLMFTGCAGQDSSSPTSSSEESTSSDCTHAYDNACDADCNVCGEERTPADHVYDNACDADCNVCGEGRTPAEHVYDNACDADCSVSEGAR